jgi:hypothetical protein
MRTILNSEAEAKKFFEEILKKGSPEGVVLYHNQRKTVLSVLKEAAQAAGKCFVEKDLSLIHDGQVGGSRFEDKAPAWLKEIFSKNMGGCVLYLREFHFAPEKVRTEIMNVMITRKIEEEKFPEGTVIILGVLDLDDVTGAMSGVESAVFYREAK